MKSVGKSGFFDLLARINPIVGQMTWNLEGVSARQQKRWVDGETARPRRSSIRAVGGKLWDYIQKPDCKNVRKEVFEAIRSEFPEVPMDSWERASFLQWWMQCFEDSLSQNLLDAKRPGGDASRGMGIEEQVRPASVNISPDSINAATRHSLFQQVIQGNGWHRTLTSIYPEFPLMKFEGVPTPMTVLWSSKKDEDHAPEMLLGNLNLKHGLPPMDFLQDCPEGLLRQQWSVLRDQERRDPVNLWNGSAYQLERIESVSSKCRIHCHMGHYFSGLATHYALQDEFMQALARDAERTAELGELRFRQWLHERDSVVGSATHRAATIGVSTLTVFFNSVINRWCFFVNERSSLVGHYSFLNGVLPSGIFQPEVSPDKPELEYSIQHHVLREFYEELYNAAAARRGSGRVSHESIYGSRPVRKLLTMMSRKQEAGRAELCTTGLAVDLIDMGITVSMLLLIRDPRWFEAETRGNASPSQEAIHICSEFLQESELSCREVDVPRKNSGLRSFIDLDDELNIVGRPAAHPSSFTPPSAATVQLGLQVARHRLQAK